MNRNENGAKPNCGSCNGTGVKRIVVELKRKGSKTEPRPCHCVDGNATKNKVYPDKGRQERARRIARHG